MAEPFRGAVHWGTRADGDFADIDHVAAPGHGVPDRPWTWLRQVHGARVVTVTEPGEHAGAEADAAVTTGPGCALSVRTADCAPVVLLSDGVVGVAHAGWKGLEAGVLEATVAAMRGLGSGPIRASLGPCIFPGCYEFGDAELARLVGRFGPTVAGLTTTGAPALDLPAAVGAVLSRLDVTLDLGGARCTACADDLYSYRARADAGRQGTFVWLVP